MANTTKLMRERLELARFSHRNGRPAHALHALADVVDLIVQRFEAEDLAAAAETRKRARPAAAPAALALDGGSPS